MRVGSRSVWRMVSTAGRQLRVHPARLFAVADAIFAYTNGADRVVWSPGVPSPS